MPKFILVDHSLRDTGGHHYPYAISVLEAAAAAGWSPALATHRDFDAREAFPPQWPLQPVFPDVSYSPYTCDTQSRAAGRTSLLRSIGAPVTALLRDRQRRRHVRRFAAACRAYFAHHPLQPGDLVFLPTASELDLLGLAAYIADAGPLPAVQWHAQLHFGIHRRRDWRRHGDTAAAARMADSLRESLRVLKMLPLHLWCTTESLAAQYTALGLATFRPLPYPVHPLFAALRTDRPAPHPTRIACLGHARREKNQRQLPELLEALWRDGFDRGALQLVVQNARAPLREALESTLRKLRATVTAPAQAPPPAAVDCSAGKLDQQSYARLVCGSDIGLLLYDAQRYHDRCSGVLLEMLVAGVPVVVPARSWLADQIEGVNQAWLAECAARLADDRRLLPLAVDAQARCTLPGDHDDHDDPGARASIGALLLTLTWPGGTFAGDGRSAVIDQFDAHGTLIGTSSRWLEARDGEPVTRCLVTLAAGTRAIAMRAGTAGEGAAEATPRLEAVAGTPPPAAAVGLAISGSDSAAGAIRDIAQHMGHYKRHSARFALECAALCNSAGIVAKLLEIACGH